MRERLTPPGVVFRGRLWSADEMAAIASANWDALGEAFRASPRLTAMVMANHPEAIGLFFALSAGQAPLVLLGPDPRSWQTSPAVPAGTRLVLTPGLAHLQAPASTLGLDVLVLPERGPLPPARPLPFLTCPGLVFFTSGSTGLPRPVFRTTRSLVGASTVLTETLRFPADAGVLAVLPLDRSYGMNNGLMAATVLGRTLGLLERFDHNDVMAMCEAGSYWYWAGAPVMADVLTRSGRRTVGGLPPRCCFAGRLPTPVARAFEKRFGTPLRQMYGTTEALTIAFDSAPDALVRVETAGHPLPGVSVQTGDDVREPAGSGVAARIWVKSPWMMEGYGFPPDIDRVCLTDGWWPTPDVGRIDADGRLTLLGRLDDRIRSGAGHVVDPGEIVAALEAYPGVIDSAVVPIDTSVGPAFGALVEVAAPIRLLDLRTHLVQSLPGWARPRVLETVSRLPRLPGGRIDRRACIDLLAHRLHQQNPS